MFTDPVKGKQQCCTETHSPLCGLESETCRLDGNSQASARCSSFKGRHRWKGSRRRASPPFHFWTEMKKNLRSNHLQRGQLGSICVCSKGGRTVSRRPYGVSYRPAWGIWLVRGRNAGLLDQCLQDIMPPLMMLSNRCVVRLPLPLPGVPFPFAIILQNGFWLHKPKGIWRIKPNTFPVMAFLSWVNKMQN